MAVDVAVTRVSCNTSTGNQDITITDFGTPKAALFFANVATSDATAASDAFNSYGAVDGTRQFACYWGSEHNKGTTNTNGIWDSDQCVKLMLNAGSTVDGEAAFSSFITDGVRS